MVSVFSDGIAINFMFLIAFFRLEGKQESYSVSFYLSNTMPSKAKHCVSHAVFFPNHTILRPSIVQAFLLLLLNYYKGDRSIREVEWNTLMLSTRE